MKQKGVATCPRCDKSMVCLPASIEICPCNEVTVSSELKVFLQKTKYGCLCSICLAELEALITQSKSENAPLRPDKLLIDIHYYIDNGQYVFTEYYHIRRGHCCENNCRHCAYGYGLSSEVPTKSATDCE